jgi:hypothetical protein
MTGIDFKNLSSVQELIFENIIENHKERQKRMSPIIDYFNDKEEYKVLESWELESIQILKLKVSRPNREEEIFYVPFLNYVSLRRFCDSFDDALIYALSAEYDGVSSFAPGFIKRILNGMNKPLDQE